MILVDFSQIVISSVVDYCSKTKDPPEIALIRHIALNAILNAKDKVASKYSGDVVLCMDGRNYWRKQMFPHYKASRKKAQAKDKFDWDGFYTAFNQIKSEFKENLPYKCVEVENAEADDIIAVLAQLFSGSTDVVILSSDKDLIQLSVRFPRVKQFSPFHKKYISDSATYNLFEHVVRGDEGDGIPNIFSDDDTFVNEGKRQVPIRATSLAEWSKTGLASPEVFCKSVEDLARLERNRKLIDLSMIPDDIVTSIRETYDATTGNKQNLFNDLVSNKLKKIMERGNF
jgi:hypothetical protein